MKRRRAGGHGSSDQTSSGNTPAQQDESDILEEVGAEPDQDGILRVDETQVRELGAVDAASVRENRRLATVIDKKRRGEKDVPFNTSDPLITYEAILQYWAADLIDIHVQQLTGSAVKQMITSRPLTGRALYDALMLLHGERGETEYDVKFTGAGTAQYRGGGRITLRDTRSSPQQGQQQPMNPFYPPPPPGYPQQGYYPPQQQPQQQHGYPPQQGYAQQAPQQQAAPQPAPQAQAPAQQSTPQSPQVYVAPAPAFDPGAMMGVLREFFGMFNQMQAAAQPPAPQQPQYQYPQQASAPQMPPPPAPTASPQEQIAWMAEAFRMFQSMQTPQHQQQPTAPPPQQQAPYNPMIGMPGMPQAPAGMIWTPLGLVPIDKLVQALGGGPAQGPRERGPMYRPPYGQQHGDQDQGGQPHYPPGPSRYAPPTPPSAPRTPAEQFRDATSVIRTAVDMVREVEDLMPGHFQGQRERETYEPEQQEDESPVTMMDAGGAKLVIDKKNGGLRWGETAFANLGPAMKWFGEEREKYLAAQARAQQQQQQPSQRQLPEGYVEVTPGFQPPPGFRAVIVDPATVPHVSPQQGFVPPRQQGGFAPPQPQQQFTPPQHHGFPPAPPANEMPPPIQSVPAPPAGQMMWGAPTMPDEEQPQ